MLQVHRVHGRHWLLATTCLKTAKIRKSTAFDENVLDITHVWAEPFWQAQQIHAEWQVLRRACHGVMLFFFTALMMFSMH